MNQYIERLQVLWDGSVKERNRVVFKLIDFDRDGVLGGSDLL